MAQGYDLATLSYSMEENDMEVNLNENDMENLSMAAYHLFLTIYSQSWTIYIHIILENIKNI